MAGVTGLEPATSGVTGQRSNQLSYTPRQEGWMYAQGGGKSSRIRPVALVFMSENDRRSGGEEQVRPTGLEQDGKRRIQKQPGEHRTRQPECSARQAEAMIVATGGCITCGHRRAIDR